MIYREESQLPPPYPLGQPAANQNPT